MIKERCESQSAMRRETYRRMFHLRQLNFAAAALVIFVCGFCNSGWSQNSPAKSGPATSAGNADLVRRGQYIVEGVALCSQCHTPRDAQGRMDRSKWLEGGSLWLRPTQPIQNWPQQAPRIAGNPPETEAEMIRLLTTGIGRDNKPLRPPMPQFRMTAEDARAVFAYLKSMAPQKEGK